MTTSPASRIRGKETHNWPPRAMDNRRKITQSATMAGNNWAGDVYPNRRQYFNAKAYPPEYIDEHMRYLREKTSAETIGDIEETDINKNNCTNHPDESIYMKSKPNVAAFRDKYQRPNNHSELSTPEALTAMQKLQKLKELQMKRDITERYYSQEIKRLIGEYYFGPKYASPALRPTGRLQNSSSQPYSGERLKNVSKGLEPCGTMTIITRLDCGCIQETTKPIFTTARGRVQRKNCNQSQDEILLKMTSLSPQEHLLKKRFPMDPRMCAKIAEGGDQEFETENEKRNDEQEGEISEHISRTTSPHRKFSDTTVNSG